jgi:PKD repeat protein
VSGQDPGPHTYASDGTYTITLEARNTGGFTTASATVVVVAAPTTPPIAEFTAGPRAGEIPPGLAVDFTDASTGATTWDWDFGDGANATTQNPSHTYNASGIYDVTLTVTDGLGNSHSQTKTDYIIVSDRPCTVPNLVGLKKNDVQDAWEDQGFVTTVQITVPPNGNYTIGVQSLPGGLDNPPGGCNATISVGP